jgi:hypothetical protein
MAIDIVEYLESTDVDIKYSGENVGPNDVAITCPWCDDPSFHLTVHRTKGYLNCWRCQFDEYKMNNKRGWGPSFKALIRELEGCSWKKAKDIWLDLGGEETEEESWRIEGDRPRECSLPEFCYTFDHPPKAFTPVRDFAYNYLLKRGFTKYHIEKYNLMFTSAGYYYHRIIVPVYREGVLVNWLGRRFDERVKGRYMNSRLDNSVIRFSETLYGIDSWSGVVIRLVEGAFDKMRIGDSALALNRSQFSRKQRNIIYGLTRRGEVPVHLLLDPEAEHRAISIGEELSALVRRIKLVELPAGSDPASLTYREIEQAENKAGYMSF